MKLDHQGASRRQFLQRSAALGAVIGSGGLLAACGGDDDDDSSGSGKLTVQGGAMTFLTGPLFEDDLKVSSELAASFRSKPQVDVKVELMDWANMIPQLTTAYASPNPPALMHASDSFMARLAAQGAFRDLNDVVDAADFKEVRDAIPQSYWDAVTLDDKIFGIPWLTQSYSVLYVNLDLIEKAGIKGFDSSYESMREAAKELTAGNVWGYSIPTTFADYAYQELSNYIFNAGTQFVAEDGVEGAIDTADVIEAMELLRQMHVVDKSTPPPGQYDRLSREALFRAGRIAILHDGGNANTITGLANGEEPKFEYGLFLLPPGPAGQTTNMGYETLHIAAKTDKPGDAWAYIKYLMSVDTLTDYLRKEATHIPTREDMSATDIYPDEPLYAATLEFASEFAPKGQTLRAAPKTIEALRVFNENFERLVAGRVSAEEMVKTANQEITDLRAV
jgi:ABC-type glycerol-3-phosphate transport system substrate-binding protein